MQTTAVNARGQVDECRTHRSRSCVDQSAVSRLTDQRRGTLTEGWRGGLCSWGRDGGGEIDGGGDSSVQKDTAEESKQMKAFFNCGLAELNFDIGKDSSQNKAEKVLEMFRMHVQWGEMRYLAQGKVSPSC